MHRDMNYYALMFICIQNFFRHFGPVEGAPYGIHPDVMDTYVKSCGKLMLGMHCTQVKQFLSHLKYIHTHLELV